MGKNGDRCRNNKNKTGFRLMQKLGAADKSAKQEI